MLLMRQLFSFCHLPLKTSEFISDVIKLILKTGCWNDWDQIKRIWLWGGLNFHLELSVLSPTNDAKVLNGGLRAGQFHVKNLLIATFQIETTALQFVLLQGSQILIYHAVGLRLHMFMKQLLISILLINFRNHGFECTISINI